MILVTTFVAVGVFAAALWWLGVTAAAAEVMAVTRSAVATIKDSALNDSQREARVQQAALRMISLFGSIVVRGVLAVVASVAPIGAAHLTGVVSASDVIRFLSRWDVALVSTAVMVTGYAMRGQLWPHSRTTPR